MSKSKPGFGALFRNNYKEVASHPDYKGSFAIDDELIEFAEADGELEVSAWKKEDKNGNTYLSLSIQKKYKKKGEAAKPKKKKAVDLDDDDDL